MSPLHAPAASSEAAVKATAPTASPVGEQCHAG
jgi:hypothetical protein